MPQLRPFPKVKALKFNKKLTMAEGFDLQAMYNTLNGLEQRVNALQFENAQLRADQQQLQHQNNHAGNAVVAAPARQPDIFRIPDPIKTVPIYDGNKKQLSAWLSTAERTLNLFRERVAVDVFSIYEQTIINKIEGKARDTICVNGNPTTFVEVAEILRAIYGDKNDMATYQTQLWSLKMEDSLHMYYKRTKEIVQNMKSLAKQRQLYSNHWEAINDFLDQECLAAFINGLNKQYFGYAQASKPDDLESAYAFLCKFQNAEHTKKQTQAYEQTQNKNRQTFNKQFTKTENQTHYEGKSKPPSDRRKVTPMEIDPSLRSRINNHDAEEEKEIENNTDVSENESDDYEEVNFQIVGSKETLR